MEPECEFQNVYNFVLRMLILIKNLIVIRDGKGEQDRVTMLPVSLKESLTHQIDKVRYIHENDQNKNVPGVFMPYSIERNILTVVKI